ncbi:MAG: DUF2911 domain-containing protein [Owenweeksia sp.]
MKKVVLLPALVWSMVSFGQLSTPPSGGNQKAVVSQYMGLTHVTIAYSSPDVTAPNGQSREGMIWGQLVPYGLSNFGFGLSSETNPSPWRAGANENTTITFSHDMKVEGQAIEAGTYGLHMIPGEEEWVIIFSHNSDAWGSYFYLENEDALRVTVKPEEHEFTEWLTYEFNDRQLAQCTASLEWENLRIPFTISVPYINELYMTQMEQELQGQKGFVPANYSTAANFALNNGGSLEKAEGWINTAMTSFGGQRNFNTLMIKARILLAKGSSAEALTLVEEALDDPSASVFQVHSFGRRLIQKGMDAEALMVFKWNAKRFPDTWPINVGLARGYAANGEYKKALKHARAALEKAPDKLNEDNLTAAIEKLENNQDIN